MRCTNAQPLLSEYIDNALSARATFEVEKHLADCHECARALNEMRRTVDLVAQGPRFEVSGDFMDRLEARLRDLTPRQERWAFGMPALWRPRLAPAFGTAVAACALGAVLFLARPGRPPAPGPSLQPTSVQDAVRQNVAIAATDPFADIGTANLTAHASSDLAGEGDALN
jgi:anti-sigma factor RsiW